MGYLRRALAAEALKLKRTPSVLIVFAGPALVNVVYLLIVATQARYITVRVDPWQVHYRSICTIWALVMLPLVTVTVTALWAGFEHGESSWKHLFALPVPRAALYGAKWLLSLALIAVSTVLLPLFCVAVGGLFHLMLPGLGYAWPPPLAYMFGHAAVLFLASVSMVTVHTWVSLRVGSLSLALGFGIACLVGSLFAAFSDTWNRVLPWTLPLRVHAVPGANVPQTLAYSLVAGIVVAAIGVADLVRRDQL